MTMSNINISTKLGIAFGLVLLLLVSMLGLSIYTMSQLNAHVEQLSKKDFVKTKLAYDSLDNVRGSIGRVFESIIVTDPGEIANAKERLQKNISIFNEDLTNLEPMLLKPEAKENLAKVKQSREHYITLVTKVMSLQASGNHEEASKLAFGETYAALHKFSSDIRTLAEFQQKVFEETATLSTASYESGRSYQLLLGVIALIMGVVAAVTISRSITRPLHEAVAIAESIADGDLSREFRAQGSDEVGQLISALQKMNQNLVTIVTEVRGGTESILTASSEIAQGNSDLSSRTEAQAGALEETASSMEELTSTVKQNADNSRQANTLSQQASGVAVTGGDVVSKVIVTMGEINNSAKKIVDIIGVIDGIAFQTNILALNAAVEAARAGEQGRGFAVVASEVRNLAQRSSSAAKEIKQLIGTSVEKVNEGSKLVNEAGNTMNDVVSSIQLVTDIMAEITAASQEQSQGIDQINRAITEMDDVTQQNAALVEEATAAAISMQGQASNLLNVVSVFKLEQQSGSGRSVNRPTPRSGNSSPLRLAS